MPDLFVFEDTAAQSAKIKIIGVGGGGGRALNNMISQNIRAVEFIMVDTDAQSIKQSLAETTLQLGAAGSFGHGSGGSPVIGRDAAISNRKQIQKLMANTDMVFIIVAMGGGTGTGAAPVIAEVAKNLGILTVAVIIEPLRCEGEIRMLVAEAGIAALKRFSDSAVLISNEKNIFMRPEMSEKPLNSWRKNRGGNNNAIIFQ
ncbi:MAG: hypothetical protein R8K50_06175 [Mariprofundus sp.]